MLGTGNALVTECYNTCFLLRDGKEMLLVDGGGGNQILSGLKAVKVDLLDLHHIFVTHKHIDHILGIVWVVRMITQSMSGGKWNNGEVFIYGHDEVLELLDNIVKNLLRKKESDYIGKSVHLVEVSDGETKNIIGYDFTFFDIHSDKAKQFGFTIDRGYLTCCGDEPYNDSIEKYVRNSKWLMHEAFCLDSEADIFNPYEKRHSTVKDSCEIAQKLNISNLILYHTEDKNIKKRKELYKQEGQRYFKGNLKVPNDLERIII